MMATESDRKPTLDLQSPGSSRETASDSPAGRKLARNYNRAAWFYEASANVYSTGQIKAAKCSQLRYLEPGQSILYLGVGAGEDALRAARQGLQVTCIDISSRMLDRLQAKLDRRNLEAELICADAFTHQRWEHYDAIATNFFLNCFKRDGMRKMLGHAISLLKPGGYYFVADVSPPVGTLPARCFNLAYSKWAMAMFWAMRLVPWHENYDYESELAAQGLTILGKDDFRLAKVGPVMFRSVVGQKPAVDSAITMGIAGQDCGSAPHFDSASSASSALPQTGSHHDS